MKALALDCRRGVGALAGLGDGNDGSPFTPDPTSIHEVPIAPPMRGAPLRYLDASDFWWTYVVYNGGAGYSGPDSYNSYALILYPDMPGAQADFLAALRAGDERVDYVHLEGLGVSQPNEVTPRNGTQGWNPNNLWGSDAYKQFALTLGRSVGLTDLQTAQAIGAYMATRYIASMQPNGPPPFQLGNDPLGATFAQVIANAAGVSSASSALITYGNRLDAQYHQNRLILANDGGVLGRDFVSFLAMVVTAGIASYYVTLAEAADAAVAAGTADVTTAQAADLAASQATADLAAQEVASAQTVVETAGQTSALVGAGAQPLEAVSVVYTGAWTPVLPTVAEVAQAAAVAVPLTAAQIGAMSNDPYYNDPNQDAPTDDGTPKTPNTPPKDPSGINPFQAVKTASSVASALQSIAKAIGIGKPHAITSAASSGAVHTSAVTGTTSGDGIDGGLFGTGIEATPLVLGVGALALAMLFAFIPRDGESRPPQRQRTST